ncbi:MAG TPA: DUF305 domain-containing protein [Nocardioides sp.]|nr:DUF305 domain-containing protein [Nocardioides sp.]
MKRLPVLVVTMVVVVSLAIALGLGLASRNDDSTGARPRMMDPRSTTMPEWWDDSWDAMGGPMMHSAAASSESAYLTEMVAHHREAVAAAGELARSDRPEMRAFGEAIVADQSAQIEQMTAWLQEWYPDLPGEIDYEPMMRDLSGAVGDQLDQMFLEDMIGHHMAAVMMSQQLLWHGTDHDDVAGLARSIRDDQHAEILRMQRWLEEWFGIEGYGGHGSLHGSMHG